MFLGFLSLDVAEAPRQVFSNSPVSVSEQRQVKPCGLAMWVSTCPNPESTSDFTFLLFPPLTALCCLLRVHVTLPSVLGASFLLLTFFPQGETCLMSPSMCCLMAPSPFFSVTVFYLCGPLPAGSTKDLGLVVVTSSRTCVVSGTELT